MKVKALKLAVIFAVFSVLAFAITIPYLLEVTGPGLKAKGLSIPEVIIASFVNMILNTFIFSLIGAKLAPKVNLKYDWIRSVIYGKEKPFWSKSAVKWAITWGIVGTLLMVMIDRFIFLPFTKHLMVNATEMEIEWWMGLSTILQGGIMEEIWLRFGVMTIIVWVLSKLFARHQSLIPAWIYWAGIVAAAILFGVGHLSAAVGVYTVLAPLVIARIIVINSLLGIGFGYLYWKKGLEYAMVAHMTADLMLHLILNQIAYMLS
ncbi:type II CAAX prenyl endopeptidase Rce1 family protein [Bacillus songklensis]|uniref:Type II CAAX prenyl endopeptidase Rce1 family protein n=1 Tax=Bacillus songklensis TaxID=1069116 RepID=A0ABV8B7Q7_9BACI